ncbi:hypothetical protein P3S67_013874 [Capsicum chacoense]
MAIGSVSYSELIQGKNLNCQKVRKSKIADEDFQTQVLFQHTSVYFALLEMKHALLHMEHTALMEPNITLE